MQRSGAPLCHAVGVEHAVRLSANPIHAATRLDTNAEINLRTVVQKPSVTLVWDCDKGMTLPVYPLLGAPADDETKMRSATFLSYCSVPFTFWRGGINFRIQFVTFLFTVGRFSVTYVPEIDQTFDLQDMRCDEGHLAFSSVIMDLNVARTFNFTVPYTATSVYKLVPSAALIGNKFEYSRATSNGVLIFRVLHSSVSISDGGILAWVWVSGAQDFELSVPRDLYNPLTETEARTRRDVHLTPKTRPQNVALFDSVGEIREKPLFDICKTQCDHFGENFMDLQLLLARQTLLVSYDVGRATIRNLTLKLPVDIGWRGGCTYRRDDYGT